MKKQILRLSLGMAWCLSALVPVHAPAAGASATADHAARRDTRTSAAQTRPSPADTLHVVFFTDIHVSPGNAQDSLFRVAIAEANASDAELVIFGGDLTNTGSDEELEHVYGLMSQLEKPWFTVMGNHETTWSESGCTTFRRIFGHDGRVAHRAGGYLFLGYNCGPYMKMADGVVRTEDLAWLGAQAARARPGERIVSLCHYPLNKDLTNRQEVVATLKRLGITASLYGHYHRLDLRNFDGIAGIPGRALAGRPGEAPGYTLLDFFADSVRIREKPLGHAARTRHTVCLEGDPQILALPCDPPPAAPDYEGRMEYVLQDSAMVLTGAGCCGDMLYYGNSQGVLRAYDTRRGREVWRHRFPDALYTTPLCTDGLVIVGRDMGLRRPDRPPKVASADRHGRRRRRARRPQLALHRAGRRLRRPHRPAQRQTALALRLRTGTGAGAPDARGRETGIRGVGQAPLLPRRRDGQMPLEMEQRPPRRVPLPGACRAPHRRRQGLHRSARPGRNLPRPGNLT